MLRKCQKITPKIRFSYFGGIPASLTFCMLEGTFTSRGLSYSVAGRGVVNTGGLVLKLTMHEQVANSWDSSSGKFL